MDIIGSRTFVEIAGDKTHELPPLLVSDAAPRGKRLERVMSMAAELIDSEELIPLAAAVTQDELDLERRRYELALQFSEQYLGLKTHWKWGDAVLEWIRQCETTFETRMDLRVLLRPDIWPHAGRTSFVTLLQDKHIDTGGVDLHKAIGLRLAFRHLPPLSYCSDQFLMYLNHSVANSAFDAWANMSPNPISALPPERFEVHVVKM
ncbi:MAG TPA: hypothetical protein VFQ91_08510 [Bryobacteraceae bacterium]|nr:hypothetical protein [Bryobacteraceae bacterium]